MWKTKITPAEAEHPVDIRVGDDVVVRVARIGLNLSVAIAAPDEVTIRKVRSVSPQPIPPRIE